MLFHSLFCCLCYSPFGRAIHAASLQVELKRIFFFAFFNSLPVCGCAPSRAGAESEGIVGLSRARVCEGGHSTP